VDFEDYLKGRYYDHEKPPHRVKLSREDIIEAACLTITRALLSWCPPRNALGCHHGKATVSPEMALRLEKAFGVSMDLLLKCRLAMTLLSAAAYNQIKSEALATRRGAGVSRPVCSPPESDGAEFDDTRRIRAGGAIPP